MRKNRKFKKSSTGAGGFKIKVNVRDTQNGWPALQAVDAMKTAMSHTVTSHDLEGQSKVSTHSAAGAFNEYISSFPHNIVAKLTGFSPWRIKGRSGHRGKR